MKGKAVPHPTTRPRARKVTRVASPTPEVAIVEAPPPPVAGPSQVGRAPLFEGAVGSSDERVGKGAPASSGEYFCGPSVRFN